ncbi:MAG: winged helix-turn-helix transcriptional regulator [Clostridia bacterium]|nr:winged helix-turn-helix transcriptional regulator [Clostridia bacterium]
MGLGKIAHAANDPIRREILIVLKKEKMSARKLAQHLNISEDLVLNHLSVLKENDLILEEHEKNDIYYLLKASVLDNIMLVLLDLLELIV